MKKCAFLFILISLWFVSGCAPSHYTLGKQYLEAEEYESAMAEFELARQNDPDDPELLRDIGIVHYSQLDFDKATNYLLQAFLQDSTDGRTLFYLGTAFEITKKYDMARDIYRRYIDVDPGADIRSCIEGRLEKLIRLEMQESARTALLNESGLDVNAVSDSAVAVLYFQNAGRNPELDPIQKGLADMIITDLSKVRQLTVVERLRLQKLFEEMGLGMTGLVDDKTAPRVGRLLGVSRLVKGTFMDLSGDRLRIDAGTIAVKTAGRLTMTKEEGRLEDLFKMEKNLVFSLLDRMHVTLSREERDAIEILETENILAFMAYCNALDYEDRGMIEQSAEFYREALQLDPGFKKAQEHLEIAENLTASAMTAPEFEQQLAAGRDEPETAETGTGAGTESHEPGTAIAETPVSAVMDQINHTGAVLDQGFLPGLDSRKPTQEQGQPIFGGSASFEIVVPLPAPEINGGGQ
ncbi:hypothetical protein JW948_07525 [bacterium]|nr:hypothetical protein [bacterium]